MTKIRAARPLARFRGRCDGAGAVDPRPASGSSKEAEVMTHPTPVRHLVACCTVVAALATANVRASAQENPDAPSADRGRDLTLRLCSNCHVGPKSQTSASSGSVPAGVPTLRAIANKPGQTARHIEMTLINPHPPMPDTQLTRREIKDVIEYLDTLRSDQTGPPFQEPPADIPAYPKPS